MDINQFENIYIHFILFYFIKCTILLLLLFIFIYIFIYFLFFLLIT